jgi:AcrR family transcriptional regulator
MNNIQRSFMMSSVGTVERTRRSEEARQARRGDILAAARCVFAIRGFGGTTIADIAEEAHIALGTIYLYVESKDDVFGALSEEFNHLIAAAVTDVPQRSLTLEETVRIRVDNVFAACEANRDLVRLVVLNTDPGSAASRRMREADELRTSPMVKLIESAMATGVIRDGDADIMTRLMFGLVSIAVYQAFVISDGTDAAKYRQACSDMILAYITPQAAYSR